MDAIPPVAEKAKTRNPLFFVLAVLSALPTAFFFLGFITSGGQSGFLFFVTAWCGMWTWVWWAMSGRYR
ncbi:hypothetical protein KIV65_gp66 [Mycobacterium phage Anthony]|uniref:Uncharacterized protein n=1 Tax=Mycobacterium phage Anthony TaxID=2599857 RepID=A0A5J6TP02_9CAUD|nr:hypothetical protein KIV65_gp66 [Mycobacterium phage Anthony]QFG10462.1 hypothetical protein PBI_ANTHONY_31 [Mycobacterium phage Anthony]